MMALERGETIGLWAAAFVVSEDALRDRFISLTGSSPDQIRDGITEPAFLVGVLDFILGHEPDLLGFCERHGLEPTEPAEARRVLAGPETEI